MKKIVSVLVVLLFTLSLMAAGCSKPDTSAKEDTEEESVQDKTTSDEAEVSANTGSSVNTVTKSAEDTVPTIVPEPTIAAVTVTEVPTVTPEPTLNQETPDASDTTTAADSIQAGDTTITTGTDNSSGLETIKETVLFDRDGIRVTAKELVNDMWGKGIRVLIENDTDSNIGIMSNCFIVNNYMCMNFTFSCIAPKSQIEDKIPLDLVDISVKDFDIITEVAVSFLVFNNDSGDNLFVTDEAVIPTSAYASGAQTISWGTTELINQDGVRIEGKLVDESSHWGTGVLLYINNSTNSDILFQCDDMLINGISIFPFFSCQVNKGREALEAIGIMDYDLSDNNITEINNIQLRFSGIDPGTNYIVYSYEPVELIIGE